ncbi:MAG: hypothetical protein ACR2PH_00805 [Desulfobulbia bacterium]
MRTQESQICLTSNCTKMTAHESGICHLHRKRRVNADGEIEWCFPANCYFKSDTKIAIADYCLIPKVRTKNKAAPIKSFAELGSLLNTAARDEQQCSEKNKIHSSKHIPVIDPPQPKQEEVIIGNIENKLPNSIWGRLVRIFLPPNSSTV